MFFSQWKIKFPFLINRTPNTLGKYKHQSQWLKEYPDFLLLSGNSNHMLCKTSPGGAAIALKNAAPGIKNMDVPRLPF